MIDQPQASGIKTYLTIWIGQLVSLIGSGLTGFALGVWVYQRNESTTQFTLIFLCNTIPGLLISPLAGAIVDRWDRRRLMLATNALSALATVLLAALFLSGQLTIWYIYPIIIFKSLVNAFHWPAFTAVTPLLMPQKYMSRAGGMLQFADAATQLISPTLGAVLFVSIGIEGVLLIDLSSFLVAFLTLLVVRIPQVEATEAGKAAKGSLWQEAKSGLTYITSRPGLRTLLIFMIFTRFVVGTVNVLATPLALTFTSVQGLGLLRSIGGVGAILGSLLMTVWGGPKRRIYGILVAELIGSLCILLAGLSQSVIVFGILIFIYFVRFPVNLASNFAIWQSKIPADMQGRVFAVLRMVAFSALPLAYVIAGPVTDYVFEPLLLPQGALATTIVGQIIGVGPGRGIALLFAIMGTLGLLIVAGGFLYPRLRLVERELPDTATASSKAGAAGVTAPGTPPAATGAQ